MASLVDDDDAWLYGDSNEEKKAELERINERLNEDTNGEPPTEFIPEEVTAKAIDPISEEDKEAGELSGEEENKEINNQIEHGSEETDSDDDDDDAVQVTIGDIKPPPYGYSGTPVNLNIKRGTFGSTTTTGPSTKTKGIDMDSVGSINGVPVYEFNLDTLEDKPWRKPGADITDYFNYGFNEETWKVYCERQRKLRIDNNVVSKTQPATGKDQQIPVATVNENSKYSGLGGLTKKAGPPPGRKMSGSIDVIGGGTPSLPSRRPANSPRENVIQVIGRKGTAFEPLPGMPPLHLPPPHMPPPFLLPPPEHNINIAPPGPVPPPGLPPPNIQATPSGNMGNQDGNFQDSFDSFNQACYVPSHSVPGNDRQAHFDEMAGFYNGNQSSHSQFDMPSESTQQSWGNSPRDRERSREHDRERDREHEERDRERDRNHNRSGYAQWDYSRDRSSGRSPAVEEEHDRRRYREYHDRPRERERDHNWERDRERDERYERDRDRERRHRDHHRDREERYRDRSSRRRHQHEEEEHEHRSSRHKHKRSKREKEEENGGGESQEAEATSSAGGGKSSGTAAEGEEKSS
ncbi:pre-mRNA 3'-end-processing factor FIP1-like [Centruroides vittatus]|uniref:pre-mRNA 3'-end-processing factor FIP1-like n=1 Tax=Centruroides vittatus TaxID=120091 RepID=UPI003510A58D